MAMVRAQRLQVKIDVGVQEQVERNSITTASIVGSQAGDGVDESARTNLEVALFKQNVVDGSKDGN